MTATQPVLIAGQWQPADAPVDTIQPYNPTLSEPLADTYPVSSRAEMQAAVAAGAAAAHELRAVAPEQIARFFERYAALIEEQRASLVAQAQLETGLGAEPRLNSTELPRTTNQLRQAAAAVRDRAWTRPTIDTKANIRALLAPLGGPVVVFGPNNFPFAFNGISGGDFVAAIAAGNPVIVKANPGHLGTTRMLAELAHQAVREAGLPAATVQLLYHLEPEVGLELVAHPLVGATGFTGSRRAGLALKAAADKAGKPIYLELSSVNPVFVLPGVLRERGEALAGEYFTSCALGAGQFCTNPGLVVVPAGEAGERFVAAAADKFGSASPGVLLGPGGAPNIAASLKTLTDHGAEILVGGHAVDPPGYRFENTLLRIAGADFLAAPDALQTEAFGTVSLVVLAADDEQLAAIARVLEGSLTGTIYSAADGSDDALYDLIAPELRQRVGRLLNDKMPTGVAVSPAMNHGGPYPSTGHPGFTAVGIPAAITRFAMLQCYDNVREHRLPPELRNRNPGRIWRLVDGAWTQEDL